ncbi:hypothetical protein [Streptomyces sp. NRRL WC-3795]|uniref:hypothetical protein n=1 Tax=Streptomyces sp. NRRL WC-3795 TaxID=1463938 RepID=UPI00131D068B|nr:hypothetical protein [Streptomyces sp. NRRL WC-3795]
MTTTLASPWYTNEVFVAALGVLATIGVGFLGAWAAKTANYPKLQLDYFISLNKELLSSSAANSSVSVTHNGAALSNPRIVVVRLDNAGRRDIIASMFHNGAPIELDLGKPILELLSVNSAPAGTHGPTAVATGSTIKVDPSHIRRKQKVSFSVLLNEEPSGIIARHHMVNVDVEPSGSISKRKLAILIFVALIMAAGLIFLIGTAAVATLPNSFIDWVQKQPWA